MEKDDQDPFDGVGGAYVIDKKTGKRMPEQQATVGPKPEPAPLISEADNEE